MFVATDAGRSHSHDSKIWNEKTTTVTVGHFRKTDCRWAGTLLVRAYHHDSYIFVKQYEVRIVKYVIAISLYYYYDLV
jgi:hypothetical protein